MKPLRVLLIGCGLIARSKHLPALAAQRRRVDLRAVCDTQENLARKAASEFGVPEVFTSVSEALGRIRPELVVLCTPPQTHRDLAVQALQAGAHLLLEKPMALTPEDCKPILAAAEQNQRRVCVAFSQSFTPIVCRAHALVESGKIGPILGMNIFLSTPEHYMTDKKDHWVHRLPGGFLSETGPHIVHMALRFLGPVRGSALIARKHTAYPWILADDLRIQLDCEKGLCSAQLLYTTRHWAARVDLMGKDGRLTLDLESGLLTLHQRPDLTAPAVFGSALSETAQTAWGTFRAAAAYLGQQRSTGHQNLLSQFLICLQDGGPLPVPMTDGLQVAETLQRLIGQLSALPAA